MLEKIFSHLKRIFAYDKLLHVFAGIGVMVMCKIMFGEMWTVGFPLAIVIAVAKEFYDKYVKKTKFEGYDILATFCGTLLYLLIKAHII